MTVKPCSKSNDTIDRQTFMKAKDCEGESFQIIAKAEKRSVINYIPSDLWREKSIISSIYIPAFKK